MEAQASAVGAVALGRGALDLVGDGYPETGTELKVRRAETRAVLGDLRQAIAYLRDVAAAGAAIHPRNPRTATAAVVRRLPLVLMDRFSVQDGCDKNPPTRTSPTCPGKGKCPPFLDQYYRR